MTFPQIPSRKTLIASAVLVASSSTTMAQDLILEEVIVTAQKREATVQDIAATVNVITGDALTRFSQFSFEEISQQTAGLTLESPNARNSNIAMRGIGTDPEAGLPSTVDVYWNDAPMRLDVAFSQIYDMERLEILRGPQGTLQGATSPAGAINMITAQPNMTERDGFIQLTASDNEGYNGQFGYGAPLIDGVLGFRVAGVYNTDYSADVENAITGEDDPENEVSSARLSLGWSPTDSFSATLAWQYLDRDTDDSKAVVGVDALGERPTLDADDKVSLGSTDNFGDFDFNIASLNLEWEVAGHMVNAVTGYTDSDKESQTENDRANYITTDGPLTFQLTDTEVDAWSQEIRISSIDNDFWDYMVGVYYRDQETDTAFTANTTLGFPSPEISFYTEGAIPVDSKTTGVFTFNTIYLNEITQLEVGLRWSNFDRDRAADVFFGDLVYLPPALAPFEDGIRDGFAASFPINAVSPENQNSDDDQVTGMVALRYDWTDDVSVYAAYNRGYRPSGISIVPDPDVRFLPNGEDDLLHDEETSDSFEAGFKGRFLNGRASLNGALFYQIFEDYLGFARGIQVLDDNGEPVDISGGLIYNGDANIFGVEFEGQILVSETWSAGGTVSYVSAEWDGAEAPCNEREAGEALGYCDIDGENIGGEPEWSFSLNSEYYVPMENMEWYVRGLWSYTGERDNIDASAGIGSVTDEFNSYSLVNLFTGLRSSDGTWDISVWAKNVFDEDEDVFHTGSDQYDLARSGGSYDQINILRERVVGLTARYNFY